MPSYTAPLRDITFVAQELLGLSRHYQQLTGCEAPDAATFAAIVEEGAKFAEQQLAPLNAVGDQHGCQWQDGKVTTPPGFADAYKRFADNGWLGLDKNPAFGARACRRRWGSSITRWCAAPTTPGACTVTSLVAPSAPSASTLTKPCSSACCHR